MSKQSTNPIYLVTGFLVGSVDIGHC